MKCSELTEYIVEKLITQKLMIKDICLIVGIDKQLRRASERDIFKNVNLKMLLNKYNDRYIPAYKLYENIDMPCSFVDLIIDNTKIDMPNIVK